MDNDTPASDVKLTEADLRGKTQHELDLLAEHIHSAGYRAGIEYAGKQIKPALERAWEAGYTACASGKVRGKDMWSFFTVIVLIFVVGMWFGANATT